MVYLPSIPSLTTNISQMEVNTPYMDCMGDVVRSLSHKCDLSTGQISNGTSGYASGSTLNLYLLYGLYRAYRGIPKTKALKNK